MKQDILAAENRFGPELGGLNDKTIRTKSKHVKISYPTTARPAYKNVVLAIDIMHVNTILFLIRISRDLQFGLEHALPEERYKLIYSALHKIIKIFTIIWFRSDSQTYLDTSKVVAGITLNVIT